MVAEIKEGVMEVVMLIAERLGVATDYLWPILLRQARIEGLCGVFYIITGLIINIFIFRYVLRCMKIYWRATDDKIRENINTTMLWLFLPVFLIITIAILANVNNILTALLNPEWYVIHNILTKVVEQIK